MATSLKGVAQGVVTDLEPDKRLNYQYLVGALTSRFEPANQTNLYRTQLNALQRKPGQSLPEMAQEIKRITRLAYPTAPLDIRDQLAKDCFVRAVNDSRIQLSIFQREPKTIDDCVRFGIEFEAFTVDQKRSQNFKPGIRMQYETETETDSQLMGHISKISQQLDNISNGNKLNTFSSRSDKSCFYCGIKGHFKRNCKKLESDKKNGSVKQDALNRVSRQSSNNTMGTQSSFMAHTPRGN